MQNIFQKITAFFMSIVAFFSGLLGLNKKPEEPLPEPATVIEWPTAGASYQAEDPASIKLNIAVTSDLHAWGDLSDEQNVALERLFSGVSKSETKLDALVIPGDLADHPTADEYRCLAEILNHYNNADHLIPAIGNHDLWGPPADFYTFFSLVGIDLDRPYWSKTVKGYSFIVLGSEQSIAESDTAYISDAQLAWLDEQLTSAQQNGDLAFIICHQVIDHTNNVDNRWPYEGSIGERSDAVRDIIRSHTDNGLTVLFVSGHLHQPFGEHSFEAPWENLYCLNLPSAQYDDYGRPGTGEGCTIEVYDSCVRIRTRNFISGEWLADTYTIPLS